MWHKMTCMMCLAVPLLVVIFTLDNVLDMLTYPVSC